MSTKFSIINAIDQWLIQRAQHNDRNYKVFHPSEWDGCHRKIAFSYYESEGLIKLAKTAYKFDPQLERIYDNGHSMHARWGKYFEALNILRGKWLCKNWMKHIKPSKCEQGEYVDDPMIFGEDNTLGVEKPSKCECGSKQFEYVELGFYDEITNWGGHVDAIVNIAGLESPIVVDFKTMNPFQFQSLEAPLPRHKTQMQIYLYLTGLKDGKFIYEDKGTQKVKEFDVPRDDGYIAVKVEEAKLLKHRVTHTNSKGQRVLPERAYMSAGHKECLRCKFRGQCWK